MLGKFNFMTTMAGAVGPSGYSKHQQVESFINETLRSHLKYCEDRLIQQNAEIMEYVALQKFAETMDKYMNDGFITKVNIGGNFFVEAEVAGEETDKILVDIGLNCYMECTRKETIEFCKQKIALLENVAAETRAESIKVKANIKLALMSLTSSTDYNL